MVSRISGIQNLGSFYMGPGETWGLDGDLQVNCSGSIQIYGDLLADDKTPDGSGITLHSTSGDIIIGGKIVSSDGESGETPPTEQSVIAPDGKDGGPIVLICDKGSVTILAGAKCRSGDGGEGGDAWAEGQGAVPLIRAQSGTGGSGGSILIKAGFSISIEGEVTGGDGERGGVSSAVGGPEGGDPAEEGKTAGGGGEGESGEGGSHSDEQNSGANGGAGVVALPNVLEALAKPGGHGGDITLEITVWLGTVSLSGSVVHGGNGGASCKAIASGAKHANAFIEAGGRGGNIAISLVDSTMVIQTNDDTSGGNGGNCGVPKLLATGQTGCAMATGVESALAWVGYPSPAGAAGGQAGGASATVTYPGPPPDQQIITLQVRDSAGGDSSSSTAIVGLNTKHDNGHPHQKNVPGGVVKLEA
jgi:hypothetical protein